VLQTIAHGYGTRSQYRQAVAVREALQSRAIAPMIWRDGTDSEKRGRAYEVGISNSAANSSASRSSFLPASDQLPTVGVEADLFPPTIKERPQSKTANEWAVCRHCIFVLFRWLDFRARSLSWVRRLMVPPKKIKTEEIPNGS
jgi:hypothetical protein